MRYGVMADIHGNTLALDAVLSALEKLEVNGYLILGDICSIGHDPVGVIERLKALENAIIIYGNADRYVFRQERPHPSKADVLADNTLIDVFQEVERSFAWTQGMVTAAGWFDWLAALPMEHRFTLPDDTRVLCVHASPNRDDGQGFIPTMDNATLRSQLGDPAADLVLVGHTHWQWEYDIEGITVGAVGPVSNPRPEDNRARFAVLNTHETGYELSYYRTAYDVEGAIQALYDMRYPGAAFVDKVLSGREDARFSENPMYQDFVAI